MMTSRLAQHTLRSLALSACVALVAGLTPLARAGEASPHAEGECRSELQSLGLLPSPDCLDRLGLLPDAPLLTGASAGGQPAGVAGSDQLSPCSFPGATAPCQSWVATYDHESWDRAEGMDLSPSGSTLFVTGGSFSSDTDYDFATSAFDTASGNTLWSSRFDWDEHGEIPWDVAASPTGDRVFVTGAYGGFPYGVRGVGTTTWSYGTVAYDAATGEQLWFVPYEGADSRVDIAVKVAVAPDGDQAFVTGVTCCSLDAKGRERFDVATLAYDAATGDQLWVQRYDGPSHGNDQPLSLSVSPSGEQVFVAGLADVSGPWSGTNLCTGRCAYLVLAYDAATGEREWLVEDPGEFGFSMAGAAAVSMDSDRVFVTGLEYNGAGSDATTVAYDTATGSELWRYALGTGWSVGSAIAVSPSDPARVFVGGSTDGTEIRVSAFEAADGTFLWSGTTDDSSIESPIKVTFPELAVTSDGSRVYAVASTASEFSAAAEPVTRAYYGTTPWNWTILGFSAASGDRISEEYFNSSPVRLDMDFFAPEIEVSPNGESLYVAGTFIHSSTGDINGPFILQEPPEGVAAGYRADFGVIANRLSDGPRYQGG